MKIKPARKRGDVVARLGKSDTALLEQGTRAALAAQAPVRIARILVPTDFSENGRKSLAYAIAMAKQFGATLTLLHVVQVNYAYGEMGAIDYAALERDLRTGSKKQLEALVAECGAAGVKATALVREGSPARAIAEVADSEEADLIVISTHGYTGLKHVLMGSIAEAVVRYAPCPVLVVRAHERDFLRG